MFAILFLCIIVTVQIPELLLAKAYLKSAPQMGLLPAPTVFSYGLCSKCTDLLNSYVLFYFLKLTAIEVHILSFL